MNHGVTIFVPSSGLFGTERYGISVLRGLAEERR